MDLAASFANLPGVNAAIKRAIMHLVPPPDTLPSAWAENSIHIPIGNAIPGPIRFDNAPYQRGMIDVVKEPGIRRIDYMLAAQIGKTTIQQCIASYFIDHEPRSQIFVQPTQGDIQTFLETKLRPMIDANKTIRAKMAKQRGRKGVNNSRIISFIGGWLMFGWAGSPKTLRGRSAPITQADEVDGMATTPEGDPVELLSQRAATFGDLALSTRSSTPTVKGESRIETGFLEGDQRRFFVACPDCHEPQFFKWSNLRWDGRQSMDIEDADKDKDQEHDPDSARYVCEHCGVMWDDGQRIAAIRSAEADGHGWKATKPFRGHASFHAPEMISTFRRMRDIVQSYLDKLAVEDMQSFVNVSLAETYEIAGEKADPATLEGRAKLSGYSSGTVPAGGLYLTAGIDMQMDRLEVEIVAWGDGEQSWQVDYRVLWGSPEQGDVWNDLDDLLAEEFPHAYGVHLPISAACLDTGGTNGMTQTAYDYAKGKTGRRLFAIKGVPGWTRPIVEKPQRKQSGKGTRKVDLFLVGVDGAKLIVMRRLAQQLPGPGYCNFPNDRDETYFNGLTCEKMVTRYVKGQPVREWHKHNRARNEPLDCRVYALAALKANPPSFKRLIEKFAAFKPAADAPEFPAVIAQTGVKLIQALQNTIEAADPPATIPALPAKPAKEKPQEEPAPQIDQTRRIIKSKRVLQAKKTKGSWATKF